jgi:tripartite-type tricarboxylate transporter receptor subunit TctC
MNRLFFPLLGVLFLAVSHLAAGGSKAWAGYPEKPIQAIMPFAPGGAPEMVFRPLLEILKKKLGQPVLIINKPGAGGLAGSGEVARAKPDGYTLLLNFGSGEHLVEPHLSDIPFKTLTDFMPVVMISYFPSGLFVRANAPWKTLEEFIEHAKKNPGALRYSHPGRGTINHLAALALEKRAGIEMNDIPTSGGGAALTMLLGEHVEAAQIGVPVAWPQVEANQIRCLAYSLPKPSDLYPGSPTYVQKGMDIRVAVNQGVAVPKNTPQEVIKILHDAFAEAFQDKSVQEVFKTIRFVPNYMNTEETTKYINEMYSYYGKLIQELGIPKKN